MTPTTFYRVESTNFANSGVSVRVDEYSLDKETPLGYWIKSNWVSSDRHWVSKTARKRYAYPTLEEAMLSFRCRKRRQITILTHQLANAKAALSQANDNIFHPQITHLHAL